MEEVVHHGLKGGWGVGEAEEHNHRFEESSICFEGGLPLVAIADSNIVVSPSDIKLHKECQSATVHSHELIHEFAYKGKGSSVSDSEGVEFSVILHQS